MSEYVHHNLRAISHKSEDISVDNKVQTKNSSDLDMGRRPKLKTVEIFVCTLLFTEI